jgi:hypothetical protein
LLVVEVGKRSQDASFNSSVDSVDVSGNVAQRISGEVVQDVFGTSLELLSRSLNSDISASALVKDNIDDPRGSWVAGGIWGTVGQDRAEDRRGKGNVVRGSGRVSACEANSVSIVECGLGIVCNSSEFAGQKSVPGLGIVEVRVEATSGSARSGSDGLEVRWGIEDSSNKGKFLRSVVWDVVSEWIERSASPGSISTSDQRVRANNVGSRGITAVNFVSYRVSISNDEVISGGNSTLGISSVGIEVTEGNHVEVGEGIGSTGSKGVEEGVLGQCAGIDIGSESRESDSADVHGCWCNVDWDTDELD